MTPNFKLSELISTSTPYPNTPSGNNLARLRCLAYKLQVLRDQMNMPLYVNSAFRTPEVNRAVGGAKHSFHLTGQAADISIRNMSKVQREKFESLILASKPCEFIKYDTFYHIAYDFSRLGTITSKPVTWQEEYPDQFPAVSTPGKKLDY